MEIKEIISLMNSPSKEEIDLVTKAFEFAKEAHKDHKRYSGEPYFLHLFETAKNLARLSMDATSIAAGLLHDVIEDAHASQEKVGVEFGPEILFLIEGVTKLGKLKYHGAERHTESLRKLFVATSQDIRVIIIKLVERLHNMQTLQHVPEHKQKRIAEETLYIYAPLAHRLGMRRLNRELEDLAFCYVFPEDYKKTVKILKETIKGAEDKLEKFLNNIKSELARNSVRNFKTDYRVKGIYSLFQKLSRKREIANVHDILAIRVIVPTESDCYKVLGILHGEWQPLPGRIKDFMSFPKPNGYRSLHTTLFTGDKSIVEVQIRTEEMHREAEFGIAAHLSYKEGYKGKSINPNLLWVMRLLPNRPKIFGGKSDDVSKKDALTIPEWIQQLGEAQHIDKEGEDLIENLKTDFFAHRVFVFTPKGDVMDLPRESSPIDFAYAVHSDIGNHVSAAKVNSKLVSLDTELHNGDIVEIIVNKKSKPNKKWLDITKTTMAKRHIRNAIGEGKL